MCYALARTLTAIRCVCMGVLGRRSELSDAEVIKSVADSVVRMQQGATAGVSMLHHSGAYYHCCAVPSLCTMSHIASLQAWPAWISCSQIPQLLQRALPRSLGQRHVRLLVLPHSLS